MKDYDSLSFMKYMNKSEIDKAINTLEGLLKGVVIDNTINQKEVNELVAWHKKYMDLIKYHPFNELIPSISLALEDNAINDDEIKDIIWLCNNLKTDSIFYNAITSDIQRLEGILHGILSDNVITKDEIEGLRDWLEENTHLTGVYPYDEINSIITAVLADGILTNQEEGLLKVVFGEFTEKNLSGNIDKKELSKIKEEMNLIGICSVCPEVTFSENVFCFTGISSRATRNEIKETIKSLNGIFKNNVSKQVNYLVVGDNGNPCWAFSCYGRKVEQAVNLRKNGHGILIIHENDFWDSLEDYMDL